MSSTGCSLITVSRASQTSSFARSIIFLACLMLVVAPISTSLFMTKGLNSSRAISLGRPHSRHFKLRTDDDNRTAGIVDALTEQVLTETSLLTLKHIGKGFKRTVVGSGDRAASSAVFDEGVDGLLEHSLFVSNDYVGSVELEKSFKTVVAVDNAAVEVVQIRGGETAAVQLNHGAKIGGNDRHNVKNHPLGAVTRQAEGLDNVKAL